MNVVADKSEPLTAIHTHLGAIFVSLELSRSSWLITSLSPGGGEKMSKHSVPGGDFAGLMERFAQLQEKAKLRGSKLSDHRCTGGRSRRVLDSPGAPERRHRKPCRRPGLSRWRRRAKTDKIDGETLVRALLAYKRGEPRVCAQWSGCPLPTRKTAATSAASAKR